MAADEFCIAVIGAGGAGVISVGELVLQAWAGRGGRGLLCKSFGPQIRGGEAAALLKLAGHERYTGVGDCDLLFAFDWDSYHRFGNEIGLREGGTVVCESTAELPAPIGARAPRLEPRPLATLAREAHPSGRTNMLVLGMLSAMLGLDDARVKDLVARKLEGRAEAYLSAALACIDAGRHHAPALKADLPRVPGVPGWYCSGNQAAAFGALRGGVRFVAAYPITPASDALEYLAEPLERLGGALVQAEDELAAINMALGAAYGGVPAFTATSGPGLALMSESLGLAVASETPVTVLNVMRGGPSTGIPTKSEQSDLNIALHGLHGDAPHLVLAPLSIADCVFTTAWSVQLALQLQVPAIVLSDQFLAQSTAIISAPRTEAPPQASQAAAVDDGEYLRYRLTPDGVSPAAVPGDPGRRFTADGLEHNEHGTPSARAVDHRAQLDKRARKLAQFDPGEDWGEIQGQGSLALLCFGSASAALSETRESLAREGIECRAVALRLLSPLPLERLRAALAGCAMLIVVEQNHGAQLFHYLRGQLPLPGLRSIAMPGPVPLAAPRLVEAVKAILGHDAGP